MDVSVYPPPPQPLAATDHSRLGQISYQDPAFGNNKLDGDAMFLGMTETGLDFGSTNQFRVPQPPMSKGTPPSSGSQNWRREGNVGEAHRLPWSYPVGDDDYNIPPLTPPTLPEHMMPPHLPHETPSAPGQYHPLDHPSAPGPHHPYQLQGMDMSRMGSGQEGRTFSPEGGPMTSTLSVMQQMVNSDSRFTNSQQPIEAALGPRSQSAMAQPSQLSTINQSQLGPNRNSITHNSPSPPGSKSATPSPSSSTHEDESEETLRVTGEKRPAGMDMKKPKTPKKKKRKDPNEPVKPVSAYALFFRDTQANIKAQNPNATFGEVSKIVASMWDGLGEEQKQVYKKRTETAKKEYLKQLAAYRASLVSQQSYNDPSERQPSHCSTPPSSSSPSMYSPKPRCTPFTRDSTRPPAPCPTPCHLSTRACTCTRTRRTATCTPSCCPPEGLSHGPAATRALWVGWQERPLLPCRSALLCTDRRTSGAAQSPPAPSSHGTLHGHGPHDGNRTGLSADPPVRVPVNGRRDAERRTCDVIISGLPPARTAHARPPPIPRLGQ
uniref:Thymocyte selection-associated high mobility group box n=1 Tax=Neogobius melanostomus TaxID=47308 RepID=A0A8C6V8K2_9GOBI